MSVSPSQAVSTVFPVKDKDSQLVAADEMPSAVLYRGKTKTAVVVTVDDTDEFGIYSADWTNAGFSNFDQLRLVATAKVDGEDYTAIVWEGTVERKNEVIDTGLLFVPDSTLQFSVPDPGVGGVPSWRLLVNNSQVATGTGASVVDGGSLITVAIPSGATPGATAEIIAEWGTGVYQRFVGLVASTFDPTGPNVRTLTIQAHTGASPATGDPVSGLQVRVAGRTVTTSTAGEAEINLNPDDYLLTFVSPIGFEPVASQIVTVAGSDVELPIQLVSTTVLEPADTPYVNVVMPVIDQRGFALPKTIVDFTFTGYLSGATRTAVVMNPLRQVTSDENGIAEIRLLRLASYVAKYRVQTGEIKTISITTPDSGSMLVVEP